MKIQKINVTVGAHKLKEEKKEDISDIEIFIFLISRRLFHDENHDRPLILVLLRFQRHSFHFTKMNKEKGILRFSRRQLCGPRCTSFF